jgi:formylglycine-generating enzyme required for sulfatase activity
MVERGDGVLRLPVPAIDLGRVLVERANKFVAEHPDAEDALRRILTLKLATVREDSEPTRRRAARSEFTDEEWRLVSELADHPNRLLVTATPEAGAATRMPQTANPHAAIAAEGGETYAEVAHEAIFRRWDKLREWIAAEREFLAWRNGLEAAYRAWQATPDISKNGALLMGLALAQAQSWLTKRGSDILEVHRAFIALSRRVAQRRRQRVQALVAGLAVIIVAGLLAWWQDQWIKERYFWLAYFRNQGLTTAKAPGESFWECAKTEVEYSKYCPEMVVVPARKFMMGSPESEKDRNDNEGRQHEVAIAKPFAVSRFELTFDQWDACVEDAGCARLGSVWGRGKQPAINVSWDEARQYVKWLSMLTGQDYRLLSEAEWEYAARAGTTTPWSSGDDEAALDDYAWSHKNSDNRTHPVGQKKPNAFGLHDMHGNVWEWVEDCYHLNYNGAPADGKPWTEGADCSVRVVRGGSWYYYPQLLRSAIRLRFSTDLRLFILGFRVGRTLTP